MDNIGRSQRIGTEQSPAPDQKPQSRDLKAWGKDVGIATLGGTIAATLVAVEAAPITAGAAGAIIVHRLLEKATSAVRGWMQRRQDAQFQKVCDFWNEFSSMYQTKFSDFPSLVQSVPAAKQMDFIRQIKDLLPDQKTLSTRSYSYGVDQLPNNHDPSDDVILFFKELKLVPPVELADFTKQIKALLNNDNKNEFYSDLSLYVKELRMVPVSERSDLIDQLKGLLSGCEYTNKYDFLQILSVLRMVPVYERADFISQVKSLSSRIRNISSFATANISDRFCRVPVGERANLISQVKSLLSGVLNVDGYHVSDVSRALSNVPAGEREQFYQLAIQLIGNRTHDGESVRDLIIALHCIRTNQRARIVERVLRNAQATAPLTDIIRALSGTQPAAANPPDAVQVHRAASQNLKPIYGELKNNLKNVQILSEADAIEKLKLWINTHDISNIVEKKDQADYRKRMLDLLSHAKWQAALEMRFTALDNETVTGSDLLRMAVTSAQANPSQIDMLLHQGLMDALKAYVNNLGYSDNISCVAGIAERFLLCFRQGIPIDDIVAEMYGNSEYQTLLSIGLSELQPEAIKATEEAVKRYRNNKNIKTIDDLRAQVVMDLEHQKEIIRQKIETREGKERADAAYYLAFENPETAEDNEFTEEQLEVLWDEMHPEILALKSVRTLFS